MSGKLIVIDGVDASGKQTQTGLLAQRLKLAGHSVLQLEFPDYRNPWSEPAKCYLAGRFGKKPEDVNPYAASTLFGVDRFCSYKAEWAPFLQSGGVVLCDRYTTSNAIHQGAKLPMEEREAFWNWLYELEYDRMGIPRPDAVFFLDMPPEAALRLMRDRANKITGEAQKDIHEQDVAYQRRCYEAALAACAYLGWNRITCGIGEEPLAPEQIHEQLFKAVKALL